MEDGRVLFYNPQTGIGKLLLKSGDKYDFTSDIWEDYGSMPETGILIECSLEGGVVKNLKALQMSIPIENDDFNKDKVLPDGSGPSTYDVKHTLQNYFNSVDYLIGDPPEVVNTKEQLDYFLSRRFLVTAYNNLRSLDPSLHDHKDIKEKLSILQELHKAYYTVGDRVDLPHLAFEMIFLRSQPEYIKYIKDKENYFSRISVLATLSQSLFPQIQKKEIELKKETNSEIKMKLENKLKPLRGRYVDAVHEKAELDEALTAMKDIKVIYTQRYFDTFVTELSLLSGEYKKVISKILNYKAYELDYSIWKYAASSKSIQEYFRTSGIDGAYSTMTFLRYYLNTLDKDKLGEEQKELFNFLKYLEEREEV